VRRRAAARAANGGPAIEIDAEAPQAGAGGSEPSGGCGDGLIQPGEVCDDGNGAVEASVKKRAIELCERYPIYR